MKIREQADLRNLNTFGVNAKAALLFEVESEEDVLELPGFRAGMDIILGGGSNILFTGDIPGNVIINRIPGIHLLEEHDDHVIVECGAGENWHQLVLHALQHGWHGLENLALIPGLAGAAPIQNIGAYGVELSSVLESVTAWDWHKEVWSVFNRDQCEPGYRDSIFKKEPRDRYLITSIRLHLNRHFSPELGYKGLRDALSSTLGGDLTNADNPTVTAQQVVNAVVGLRESKLPDPGVAGNAGSFFKNPIVDQQTATQLQALQPDLPGWQQSNEQVKLSAAWLIESCGFKGKNYGAAAVSAQHALVLINQGGASGRDIWQLARQIQTAVDQRYGIWLEPEPRIYPSQAV